MNTPLIKRLEWLAIKLGGLHGELDVLDNTQDWSDEINAVHDAMRALGSTEHFPVYTAPEKYQTFFPPFTPLPLSGLPNTGPLSAD